MAFACTDGTLVQSYLCSVFGASWVAVSEPASKRRELATLHGADVVYDPTSPGFDVPATVRQATGDRGADVVLDCAGNQRTLDTAFHAVRPRGSVVNVAVWENKPVLDIDAITYKEFRFTGAPGELLNRARLAFDRVLAGVLAYDRVHGEVLEAVAAGKFSGLENLITRRITLEDFVEKGVKALMNEKDEHGKRILSYRVCRSDTRLICSLRQ